MTGWKLVVGESSQELHFCVSQSLMLIEMYKKKLHCYIQIECKLKLLSFWLSDIRSKMVESDLLRKLTQKSFVTGKIIKL